MSIEIALIMMVIVLLLINTAMLWTGVFKNQKPDHSEVMFYRIRLQMLMDLIRSKPDFSSNELISYMINSINRDMEKK